MKKVLFFYFFGLVFQAHAQSYNISYFVNKSLSILDGAVPNEFRYTGGPNNNRFVNDENIVLFTRNGIVYNIYLFPPLEAYVRFHTHFVNNNWRFLGSSSDNSADMYLRNGVYAYIFRITGNNDPMIAFFRLF